MDNPIRGQPLPGRLAGYAISGSTLLMARAVPDIIIYTTYYIYLLFIKTHSGDPDEICGNFTHRNSLPSKFYSPGTDATLRALCKPFLVRTALSAG
ncbi:MULTISPECIES: hypothetical protein [unclassified Desulfovibrio]|uniref:hypothetical protein n=1 Tax=unclassified Desulfovibrio TaxID=2593640 RepID=UPI002FDB8B22